MTNTFARNMMCANCGQEGHVYKKCVQPITSYGIICVDMDRREYVMVQRKDSLAYVEFLRGKYTLCDQKYIMKLLSLMTFDEQARILKNAFDVLWRYMWQVNDCMSFRREYDAASAKFEQLRRGYASADGQTYVLADLIQRTESGYPETEWGFAKGRRNIGESDMQCALREFQEESGIEAGVDLQLNPEVLIEVFNGSNGMTYRHVYFVAKVRTKARALLHPTSSREVGAARWFSYEAAQGNIRDYNPERKALFASLDAQLFLMGASPP